ncbi:MAG: MAPEG family protein [Pseudomonadota bacterium]
MVAELGFLGWSVVLLLVHIILQASLATKEFGMTYNASPRDENPATTGLYAGRAKRALLNFLETYPAFIALAIGLELTKRTGGTAETGALIWLCARCVYLPVYLAGIPMLRTLIWAASLIGLVMMLARFMGWS